MQNLLKKIPKIDKLINDKDFVGFNKNILKRVTQNYIQNLRQNILNRTVSQIDYSNIVSDIKREYQAYLEPSLKRVINATGVILHTNMGRSPLSKEMILNVLDKVCNYTNLEYNLEQGKRGERYEMVSFFIKELFGVEDALIVNNNASAVFLVLNTFAKGKEAIVSRGELVEIGGSFRVPDVMSNSGAILKEIGTTNKTHFRDYENAISSNSAILMKVHKSNYTIKGFTSEVEYEKIANLAKERGLIDYYDLGSGYIKTLPYNLGAKEPSVIEIIKKAKPSLISFSGDKLLGSVQAGIILGRKELIAKLKKNQLLRMLRVDKLTLSLLEESFKAYLLEDYDAFPILRMLFTPLDELKKRAEGMCEQIGREFCEVVESKTVVGGGTLPNKTYPSIALHIFGDAKFLEKQFRKALIIGRIEDDKFLLDLRTVASDEEAKIIKRAKEIRQCDI